MIEALGRSLARYFEVAATSLWRKKRRMAEHAPLRPTTIALAFNPFPPSPQPEFKLAPQHPLAPEIDHPLEPLDWVTWCRMETENRRHGWAFVRFAVRGGDKKIGFVFGMVRGTFGVYSMTFHLCPINAEAELYGLSHLRSGFGFGLFSHQETAAEAAEIAGRMSTDWSTFDPDAADTSRLGPMIERVHEAWKAAGIVQAPFHAHKEPGSMAITVWHFDVLGELIRKPTPGASLS